MGPGTGRSVDTRDPDEAVERLSAVYCPHRLTLADRSGGFRAQQRGAGLSGLWLYDLSYGQADVVVDPVPFDDFVLVTRPLSGRFVVQSLAEGVVRTERDPLVMDAYGRYQLRWQDSCRVLHMVLDRVRLERIAAELRGFDEPIGVRFQLGPPTSESASRAWAQVTGFVRTQVDTASAADLGPLVSAEIFRLTVAALLAAYPSSCGALEPPPPGSVGATAVRRATAYIELHAGEPIGVHDIASAARISTRGLQAAFQLYEETTPLSYLRQTRLRRAHADLRAGSPERTTVAAVASRWGFVNLGRFAAEHRKLYGKTPSEVLAER